MFTKAALTDAMKSGTKICLPGATAKLEAQAGLLRYLTLPTGVRAERAP